MVKLYLKKLLSSILFSGIFFLFLVVVAYVWVHISSACTSFLGFEIPNTIDYCIVLILTLLLELIGVYFLRVDSLNCKEEYTDGHKGEIYIFSKDFICTLRSSENIVHIIAFLTFVLPFYLLIAISEKAPLFPSIAGMLALSIVTGALFGAVNTLSWCFVHRNWLKNKDRIP